MRNGGVKFSLFSSPERFSATSPDVAADNSLQEWFLCPLEHKSNLFEILLFILPGEVIQTGRFDEYGSDVS